jgi:hypothetical protein
MAEPVEEMRISTNQLAVWRAAIRMSMMSVMPGMGRGTKDESTMATKKRPKRPRLRTRWKSGECFGRGARTARARGERMLAATAFGAAGVMPDYDA